MAVINAKTVAGIESQPPDDRTYIETSFRWLPSIAFVGDASEVPDPASVDHRQLDPAIALNFYDAYGVGSVNSAWTRWVPYRNDEKIAFEYSIGYIRAGVFPGFALYNNARRRMTVTGVSSDNAVLDVVGVEIGDPLGEYGDLFFSLSFVDGFSGPVDAAITFEFSNGETAVININATLTHEIFPFRIDYSENITAKWLNDIGANHLSPSARGFLDGQQTIRKRRLAVQVLASGDDVPLIEDFFAGIGCDAFWLMDLPRDFDNVSAAAESTTLYLECGDLPSFVTTEHAYVIALMPHGGTTPIMQRIVAIETAGDGYNITTDNPFTVDVSNDDYEVSLGALVAVDGDTVSFEPHTGNLWKIGLSLIEQPYETVDAIAKTLIVYRYTFTCTDHLGNEAVHKYTTAEEAGDFTPLDIIHDGLSFGLFDQDNKCSISMQATTDGPFAGWTPMWMGPPVNIVVERVDNIYGNETVSTIFSGECVEVARQGQLIEAKFKPRAISGKIPNFFASVRDNLDQWIEHDIESFRQDVTLQGNNGNLLTVSWSAVVDPAILEGGYLVYEPAAGLAEVRDILAVEGELGETAIILHINGLVTAGPADGIACYQGYDGGAATYVDMFGSLDGFGGHPMITTTNPAIKAIKLDSDLGGKK